MGVIFWGSGGRFFGFRGSPGSGVGVPQNRGSGVQKSGIRGVPRGWSENRFFSVRIDFLGFGGPGGHFEENPGFWPKVGGGPEKSRFLDPHLDRGPDRLFSGFSENPGFGGGDPRTGEKVVRDPGDLKKSDPNTARISRKVEKK